MRNTRFDLRPLKADDKVRGLALGDAALAPLKTFVARHAKVFQDKEVAKTYVLQRRGARAIVGYITLVTGEIATDFNIVDDDARYPYNSYPVVKIARLAIDRRYRGRGLGRFLIEFAVGMVKRTIAPVVGCRFVVVDAKREAVPFYRKCGFVLLDTAHNRRRPAPVMFIDLKKLPAG